MKRFTTNAHRGQRSTCCLVSSALLMLGAGSAQAQSAGAKATAPASEFELEEVVITSQHVQENLQSAALAVSVLSAGTLTERSINEAEDMTRIMPSVTFTTGGGGSTQVALRGIGALTGNAFAEQVVAFNINGVYAARTGATNGMFYDLERVEVLKGPQGTLYGRNATAGAINLITAAPEPDFFTKVSARVGNYGLKEGDAVVNLPVNSAWGLRFAGQAIQRDGYFSDGYGDQKQQSGRMSVAYNGGAVDAVLVVGYAHTNNKGPAQVLAGPYVDPNNPFLGPSSPQTVAYYRANVPIESPPISNGFNLTNLFNASATVNVDLGEGKLTLIPAYQRSRFNWDSNSPGFRLRNQDSSSTSSFEARYLSPESYALHGVVGLYFINDIGEFHNRTYINDLVAGGPDPTDAVFHTKAKAIFGQGTYDLTPQWRLIAGGRYSKEDKTDSGSIRIPAVPFKGDLSFSKFNYRLGVETDLAERSMAYFTYATGFKAGGFYPAAVPNTFKPEYLNAWTLGTKNRFLGNRLQFNVEAFYWDYKDKQVNHLGPINPGGFTLITENAGQATLYGVELESAFKFTEADTLSGSVQYEHTRYDSFVIGWDGGQRIPAGPFAGAPIPPPTTCPTRLVNPTGTLFSINCSGNELAQAPRWAGSLNYDHVFFMPGNGEVKFSASLLAKSKYWIGEEHVAGQLQPGYMTADVSLDYKAAGGNWSAGLFVDNVGDRVVKTFSIVHPILQQPVVSLAAPRTYGVRGNVKF